MVGSEVPAGTVPGRRAGSAPAFAFWMLIGFLFLEYVRPSFVEGLKIQLMIVFAFPVLWLGLSTRPWTTILSAQAMLLAWSAKGVVYATNTYTVYMTTRALFGNVSIALALTWVCSNMRCFRRVIWFWVAIMVFQAIWSLGHGGHGFGSFMGDENDLALACVTAVTFTFLGLERLRGRARWLCGAGLLLLIAGIVGSLSRGGFVGLVVVVTYCVFVSRKKLRTLAVIGATAALLPLLAPASYIEEIRSISETSSGTAKTRRFLWSAGFNMWQEYPVLGLGAGNASHRVGEFQPTDTEGRDYQERSWSFKALHSFYFTALAEHGTPGVLLIGFIAWAQFRTLRSVRRKVRTARQVPHWLRRDTEIFALGLNGALLGFLTAGIFVSVLYYPFFWHLTALAGALDLAVRRELALVAAHATATNEQAEDP